jgi:spore maturation protein CgeB
MKIALFYHSLYSDWNHGNAHFLRGVVKELQIKGHEVNVYEPSHGWSMQNLLKYYGKEPLEEFHNYYPGIYSHFYDLRTFDFEKELKGTDLVIVHEWNEPELISKLGYVKTSLGYLLFFHDTHHRAVTQPETISGFDLAYYDGVLAFGEVIRNIYLLNGWVKKGWVWHEAADVSIFKPPEHDIKVGDIVWIGNWGDEERTEELHEFLISPVKELKLRAKVYGVRFPMKAIETLTQADIEYGGWIPNYKVPQVYGSYRVTVHIPRRPYVERLPGIPTIRPFEAMACGIPLICSPWSDSENLFTENLDYLIAQDKDQMKEKLSLLFEDLTLARNLSGHALKTIHDRHTCRHRVEQLEEICVEMGLNPKTEKLQEIK